MFLCAPIRLRWWFEMKLLAFLVLYAALTPTNRHAWTFTFRSAWNHECAKHLTDMTESSGLAFCDCVSDELQDHYSEKEFAKVDDGGMTEADEQYIVSAYQSCDEGVP